MDIIGEVMGVEVHFDGEQYYYEWDGKKFLFTGNHSHDEVLERARLTIAQYEQWKA